MAYWKPCGSQEDHEPHSVGPKLPDGYVGGQLCPGYGTLRLEWWWKGHCFICGQPRKHGSEWCEDHDVIFDRWELEGGQ